MTVVPLLATSGVSSLSASESPEVSPIYAAHPFNCHKNVILRRIQELEQDADNKNCSVDGTTSDSTESLANLQSDTGKSSASAGNSRFLDATTLPEDNTMGGPVYVEEDFLPESFTVSANLKQYYVTGEVNGKSVEAFPDSGADESFVSATFASELGLKPKRRSQRKVRLANQKTVQSPGYVELNWKFDGEEGSQILKCWILPSCVHGLIVGNRFMRASDTLTKFFNRIKSRILPSRKPKVRLLGREQQRVRGSLNGSGIAAMPDTGSDIMLVSPAVAARHNMRVDTEPEHCLEIEMADGSRDRTMGCAKDVPWTVGSHTVRADFYVLRDLSVDVVLSNDYLFENNIFTAHKDAFFDAVVEDEILQLCNIRLIGKYGESLNILEEDWRADCESQTPLSRGNAANKRLVNSPHAFAAAMIRKEVARRDMIRDRILELPEGQREPAFSDELDRQRLWEQLRRAHDVRAESITATDLTPANKTSKRSDSQRASLRLWWMRRFGSLRR